MTALGRVFVRLRCHRPRHRDGRRPRSRRPAPPAGGEWQSNSAAPPMLPRDRRLGPQCTARWRSKLGVMPVASCHLMKAAEMTGVFSGRWRPISGAPASVPARRHRHLRLRGDRDRARRAAVISGCSRASVDEFDFTVFATAFRQSGPDRIRWVRVPAVTRPLAARFVSYYLTSTAGYRRSRRRAPSTSSRRSRVTPEPATSAMCISATGPTCAGTGPNPAPAGLREARQEARPPAPSRDRGAVAALGRPPRRAVPGPDRRARGRARCRPEPDPGGPQPGRPGRLTAPARLRT